MKKCVSVLLSILLLISSLSCLFIGNVSAEAPAAESLPDSVFYNENGHTVDLNVGEKDSNWYGKQGNTCWGRKAIKWGNENQGGNSYLMANEFYQLDMDVTFSEDINPEAVFWVDMVSNYSSQWTEYSAGIRYELNQPGAVETAQNNSGQGYINQDGAHTYDPAKEGSPAYNGAAAVVPGKTYRYTYVLKNSSQFVNYIYTNVTGLTAGSVTVSNLSLFPLKDTLYSFFENDAGATQLFSYMVQEGDNTFLRCYAFNNIGNESTASYYLKAKADATFTGADGAVTNSFLNMPVKGGNVYNLLMDFRVPTGSQPHGGNYAFSQSLYEAKALSTDYSAAVDALQEDEGFLAAGGASVPTARTVAASNYYREGTNDYSYNWTMAGIGRNIRRPQNGNELMLSYTNKETGAVVYTDGEKSSSNRGRTAKNNVYSENANTWLRSNYQITAFGQTLEQAQAEYQSKFSSMTQYLAFYYDAAAGTWKYNTKTDGKLETSYVMDSAADTEISWTLRLYKGDVVDVDNPAFRQQTKVSVNIEGNGNVANNANEGIFVGDQVTYTAVPFKYESFLGWYDASGNLLSNDGTYTLTVAEGSALTAKFSTKTLAITADMWKVSPGAITWTILSASTNSHLGGPAVEFTGGQFQFIYAPVTLEKNTEYSFDFSKMGNVGAQAVSLYPQAAGMSDPDNIEGGGYKPANGIEKKDGTEVWLPNGGIPADNAEWETATVTLATKEWTDYYLVIKMGAPGTASKTYISDGVIYKEETEPQPTPEEVLKAHAQESFDMVGTAIRTEGTLPQALRFKATVDLAALAENAGLDGYTMQEYGFVVFREDYLEAGQELTKDTSSVVNDRTRRAISQSAYVQGEKDIVFDQNDQIKTFTAALTGIAKENYNARYVVRVYAVYKAADGSSCTVYDDTTTAASVNEVANAAYNAAGSSYTDANGDSWAESYETRLYLYENILKDSGVAAPVA